jgi:hypothetical protein
MYYKIYRSLGSDIATLYNNLQAALVAQANCFTRVMNNFICAGDQAAVLRCAGRRHLRGGQFDREAVLPGLCG